MRGQTWAQLFKSYIIVRFTKNKLLAIGSGETANRQLGSHNGCPAKTWPWVGLHVPHFAIQPQAHIGINGILFSFPS